MLVVGVDLGTQSLKAVVCDERLTVRGQHAVASYATHHPRPGRAEQDPRAWEAALAPAIAGALAAAGVRPADIAALALAGQLDGCVAVDAAGAPVHPALIWYDRRAVAEAARADPAAVFALAGQVADAGHMAPKIAWLRARAPAARRFHQPVSYLVERLTGAAVLDPAHASTTMLFDLAAARWSDALLAAFELDAAALPADPPGDRARAPPPRARRSPACPPARRSQSAPATTSRTCSAPAWSRRADRVRAGHRRVVGAVARAVARSRRRRAAGRDARVPRPARTSSSTPAGSPAARSAWAVELLGLRDAAALDALAAAAPPGAGGVTFVPALAGAMTPVWRPHARGTLHGLAAGHGRELVARAILEGLAFAARDVVERLVAMGLPAERVLVLGGGAASAVWTSCARTCCSCAARSPRTPTPRRSARR